MAQARVLVLRAAGTNCDLETQAAWEAAGARAERMHLGRLIECPERLHEFDILTIPGGFSYGDDIAAGRIFAARLRRHLLESLVAFVQRGRSILGICNGFQVLVKAGLLPYPQRAADGQSLCTVTHNHPPGFQARWVRLRAADTGCIFLEAGRVYELPIAHAEGRVRFAGPRALRQVESDRLVALRYAGDGEGQGGDVAEAGVAGGNPNGSEAHVAGLCDPSGRVFGLMPHPERFVRVIQHPCWTSGVRREPPDGLRMFQAALDHLR